MCVCFIDGLLVQPVADSLTHMQTPPSVALAQPRPAKEQKSIAANHDRNQLHLGKTHTHTKKERERESDVLCLGFVPDFEHM